MEKNIYYINAAITLGEMIKLFHYFFIPRAAEIVRYEIDGTLTYFEKYESTISSLNLMHSTLIFMRKIWAKIVINNISLNQVNKAFD